MILLHLCLLATLLFIAYQDFKTRAISTFTIPLLFAIVVAINLVGYDFTYYIQNTLINIAIIFVQLLLVNIYFIIKNRNLQHIVNRQIGIGDILFLATLCFLLRPVEFVLFLTISFTVTLFLYILVLVFRRDRKQMQIPLAGAISVLLALYWIFVVFFRQQPLDSIFGVYA